MSVSGTVVHGGGRDMTDSGLASVSLLLIFSLIPG